MTQKIKDRLWLAIKIIIIIALVLLVLGIIHPTAAGKTLIYLAGCMGQ